MDKRKITPYSVLSMLLLLFLTISFIFPFYWIVSGSLKLQDVALAIPPEWIPKTPTLENFAQLFNTESVPLFFDWTGIMVPKIVRWFFNSVFVSCATTILVCVSSSLAGYALAKKRFIGAKIVFILFIAAMSLPKQVIMVPLVQFLASIGMIDTYRALILPAVGWPFGVFLMKQFTQSVPNEVIESARIDGCSELRTFGSIVLPMVKPGIGALAIFTFISSWNDYFSQLLFTRTSIMSTLPLGVATMAQSNEFTTNYGMLMAGAFLASIPMIIVFLCFQDFFTQGITMGAVKG